jgi:hypothetical protein
VKREELEELIAYDLRKEKIWAHSLTGPDRTLLYGYTCDRDSFHVYLRDGKIHRFVYQERGEIVPLHHRAEDGWELNDLVPDKRVYPESTDYVLALRLRRSGVQVPYLPFDGARYDRVRSRQFCGMLAP